MENTRVRALAFVLLFLSGTVSAAVSTRTVDLSGSFGIAEDVDGQGYTDLLHKYIFDLPGRPSISERVYHVNTGLRFDLKATNDPVFTVTLHDRHDNLLATATGSDDPLSPDPVHRIVNINRVLPAGEDYYTLVTGHSNSADVSHHVFLFQEALPIPEPETYAMFIAGLGLLGWRLRYSRS